MTQRSGASLQGASRRGFLRTGTAIASATALAGFAVPHVHAAGSDVIKLALVGCGGDDTPKPSSSTSNGAGSSPESAGSQWPMYGHDFAQTRTNVTETGITRDNVDRLAKVWEIPDVIGVTGTPTVVDGVAYFADWKGAVWAVRADTGEKVWTSQIGGSIVGSPAVDGDGVYASSGASLYRLDRKTGEQRWKATTDDHPQAQISASPVVVDGIVLQGTASFENMMRKDEYLFRGSIAGFDAAHSF